MQGNAVNLSYFKNTEMIYKLKLTENLCYVVLDCDEHDGELRCDLGHKERHEINGLILSQKHFIQRKVLSDCPTLVNITFSHGTLFHTCPLTGHVNDTYPCLMSQSNNREIFRHHFMHTCNE